MDMVCSTRAAFCRNFLVASVRQPRENQQKRKVHGHHQKTKGIDSEFKESKEPNELQ